MKYIACNQEIGRKREKRGGFAMLFAVLVSSVLLSIGLSIFNLTVKELVLSSSGRESQFSFYAADTGAECAIYWDVKGKDIFATSSDSRSPFPSDPNCVGAPIDVSHPVSGPNSATTQFVLNIPGGYCSIVTVRKWSDAPPIIKTEIDSRGYNTPCPIDAPDQNRVERALKVTY